jgi:hypothetical protein
VKLKVGYMSSVQGKPNALRKDIRRTSAESYKAGGSPFAARVC